MQTNPLVIPVLELLKSSNTAVRLLDIVSHLENEHVFQSFSSLSPEIKAFRKNFLVMNALYYLQRDLLDTGFLLSISAVAIKIEPLLDSSSIKSLAASGDEKLADYYLDWTNYYESGQQDIENLLNGFWDKYFALDKRNNALQFLGLASESDWGDVQISYRRLAKKYHPDMGGNASDFIKLREAYELLRHCYNR